MERGTKSQRGGEGRTEWNGRVGLEALDYGGIKGSIWIFV